MAVYRTQLLEAMESALLRRVLNLPASADSLTVRSERFTYFCTKGTGAQIAKLLAQPHNFTKLRLEPGVTFAEFVPARRTLTEIDAAALFNATDTYVVLFRVFDRTPYALALYPSAAYPTFSLRVYDDNLAPVGLIDFQQTLKQPLVVWFPTYEEMLSIQRVRNLNGNYVCYQQDVRTTHTH